MVLTFYQLLDVFPVHVLFLDLDLAAGSGYLQMQSAVCRFFLPPVMTSKVAWGSI